MIFLNCIYDYVLFDLDGTLSASAPGIRRCIELTMEKMGREIPDLSDYSKYIGPPLITTFQKVCGLSPEDAQTALHIYLDYYDTEGEPRNSLFDGILHLLERLRESNAKVAVCTSKNEISAKNVCDFLGITPLLDALCGSDHSTGRREKEDIIPYAMETLGAEKGDKVVMIGDTHFDAKGAVYNNIDFIGVTYGYGKKETMWEAGARAFAYSALHLEKLLFAEEGTTADDLRLNLGSNRFQLRVGAIIMEGDSVLLATNSKADYYYSVGGAVKMGETAQEAVKREVFEETGISYEVDRLVFVHENFFRDEVVSKGTTFHEVCFYFLMKPLGEKRKIEKESFCVTGEETMHWVPVADLQTMKVFPVFFADKLGNLPETVEHIVISEL
ncbi:MAG: NUDIX domain-containing protein [Ruminococcaceae bacterium]|nr:NUDIX domain-containing protein [Oscillospiraceae bacterium]